MTTLARGVTNLWLKSPEDVVILQAIRTPLTRAKKGGLRHTYPEDLVSQLFHSVRERGAVIADRVEDVCIGNVCAELGFAKTGRMALNHSGFNPIMTTFSTTNRQCASGLQAVVNIANAIQVGQIAVGLGGGVESMTRNYFQTRGIPLDLSPEMRNTSVKSASECLLPMGITSENVASRYGISRSDQDMYALSSHQRAYKAQSEGLYDAEIVPVHTKDDSGVAVIIDKDDGIRPSATLESLAKLQPVFKNDGSSTAGNS